MKSDKSMDTHQWEYELFIKAMKNVVVTKTLHQFPSVILLY